MTVESNFRQYLTDAGVRWSLLDSAAAIDAERRWRDVYGQTFVERSRVKTGAKADNEYRMELSAAYLIVPFTSGVNGLPVHVLHRRLSAYECNGPLVDFSSFHDVELFVSPFDYEWTMVYTHEDHACGGPYFHRREWINADEPGDAPKSRSRRF
ncbi:hypothetical protein [Stieleria magnilauensis]|uniref:Uncharacterized protein n=1 Tax=Stieleria magnilauensis TaxID=2527963 RepID=A0ABX5XJA7_9BACT|nr:hypothetical protein TBK1r_08190 [Planctomycetes bacterium TBK1r]